MSQPGYPEAAQLVRTNGDGRSPDGPNGPVGFFGGMQGATPKYAKNLGLVTDDFRDSMARFFIKSGASESALETRITKLEPASLQALARKVYGNGYIDFILQNVSQGLSEKLDLVENMSDGYVAYYLGQMPATLQCSGVLINSLQDDQVVSMVGLYMELLRGTKLAEHRETVRLRIDSFLYTGTLNNLQWSLGAENELYCPFSFTFLVKSRKALPSQYFRAVSLESRVTDIDYSADAAGPTLSPQLVTSSAPPVVLPPAASDSAAPSNDAQLASRNAALEQLTQDASTTYSPAIQKQVDEAQRRNPRL